MADTSSSRRSSSNSNKHDSDNLSLSASAKAVISSIEDIISQDEGGRGMASLVVKGDLELAAKVMARLQNSCEGRIPQVLILSGFPCCVNESPPTETDGPPGTLAIAKAAVCLGYDVTIVTDNCNKEVFYAACSQLDWNNKVALEAFPAEADMSEEDYTRLNELADNRCDLVIACERAGPAKDGHCYTMRGIDMTSKGLIAPLHKIVDRARGDKNVLFLAIGDGGNELGMGKVYESIVSNPSIRNGSLIAATMPADYLIAASVSNWGGYALASACACVKLDDSVEKLDPLEFIPKSSDEVNLLDRCVKAGCRDGVSGEMECTVDGMPLKTSLDCLENIRSQLQSFTVNILNKNRQ